jgi:hypothetical protein
VYADRSWRGDGMSLQLLHAHAGGQLLECLRLSEL